MKINQELVRVNVSFLRKASSDILKRHLHISKVDADKITEQLLYAEFYGKKTHGVIRIPWILKKNIKGNQLPDLQKSISNVSYFDCSGSIGYLAADHIAQHVNKKIKNNPFYVAVARNIFPTGALSFYVRKLIKGNKNIIFVFGTTPDLVKMPSGKQKIAGTNPFSAGFFYKKKKYFLIDITTAQSTFGELLASKYELIKFDNSKYHTKHNHIPRNMNELFDGDQFTGSILQRLDSKSDFRQYSLMMLVQFLTVLLAQHKTNNGDLIFIAIKRNSNKHPIFDIGEGMTPDSIPGMHGEKVFLLNSKKKTILVPKKLLKELENLTSS